MELNKKSEIIKIAYFVICISLIFMIFSFVSGESTTSKEKESQDLKNQINSNNTQISATQAEATTYLQQIDDLNNQISEYSDDLTKLQSKVDEVNQKIDGYESDLQNSAQRFSSAEDLYSVRIRSIYENGIPSIFDILLSSQGIADFFSKLNVYQSIIEYDKSMVSNIDGEKSYIDNVKNDIEVQKVQLDQLKYDVEKSTTALNNAKAKKQTKVDELNSSAEKLKAVNTVLQQQADELDKQVQKELEEVQKKAAAAKAAHKNTSGNSESISSDDKKSVVTGNSSFIWPLKGYGKSNITATFPCYPDGTKHTGVDIGVPIGTPVYAAQSGLVTKSKYYLHGDRDGGYTDGYGNTVWISDGTYTVIYGHLRYKQVVNEGDYVQQGQLVAYTASTGNSSGPHLHFEIRKGTAAVNPLQFFN